MALIQIRMSVETGQDVIKEMKQLLRHRRRHIVGRRKFLSRWGKLRRRLEMTDEYIEWRAAVFERDGGLCVVCGNAGTHVHHPIRVAVHPDGALKLDNGETRCRDCHKLAPGHSRWLK